MQGKRLIRHLELGNFLSYGSGGIGIDLEPLNVLIGPNASGKSNLIEALSILRSTSRDLASGFRQGGGVAEYIWKGAGAEGSAIIKASVEYPWPIFSAETLEYELGFRQVRHRAYVTEEYIGKKGVEFGNGVKVMPESYYHLEPLRAVIQQRVISETGDVDTAVREIGLKDLANDKSVLSQRRDPDLYPELTYLADHFERITIFQEWTLGRDSKVRQAQATDLPTDFLLPNASNLVLVLHDLLQRAQTEQRLIEYLRRFYPSAQRIRTRILGGTIALFIDEGMDDLIPAMRLSDGTLRYLALLAILLHPDPPPLICIEEPELGLHPDVIPTIAELLLDASQRTQLVVTTHSDTLVSALSDHPEAIVVCEQGENGTTLRRLDREQLSEWLKKYSLGEIWRMGEIGGTRW